MPLTTEPIQLLRATGQEKSSGGGVLGDKRYRQRRGCASPCVITIVRRGSMKILLTALVLKIGLVVVAARSMASTYYSQSAENPLSQVWSKIRVGMTRTEVWKLLGDPISVDQKDRSEAWSGPLVRKPELSEPPTYYRLRVVYGVDAKVVLVNPYIFTALPIKK
jgi:hypothetical protein